MTKKELASATAMALDPRVQGLYDDIGVFDGFGLAGFEPVTVTIRQLAGLIRWQAVRLNGTLDNEALAEIESAGRRKFTVVSAYRMAAALELLSVA